MRKILNNPWVVGTLAVGAVAFVAYSVWPEHPHYGPGAPDTTDTSLSDPSAVDAGGTGSISIVAALKALNIAATVRDPFAQVTIVAEKNAAPVEKTPPPDLVDSIHVSAVWIQKENCLALINGRIVAPGEELGRIRIESASSEGVWLSHWKGRNFVAVGGDFSLVTPANQPLTTSSLP